MPQPTFDVEAAHQYFAAHCFNSAWDLIEKPDRTPADDQLMVALAHASLYHWLSRPDCTDKHLSIGYWQASRIQSILRNAAEARRYAEICLSHSTKLDPFHLGYAHEALARAALLNGDREAATKHLTQATALSQKITNEQDREALNRDLASLAPP